MSINIYLNAVRDIKVLNTGITEKQIESFDLWQTPSKVTTNILVNKNGLKTYKKWVLSISNYELVDVFDADDIFMENSPIGVKKIHVGKSHIKHLNEWLKTKRDKGYKIEFEGW